jgi:SNF2 family DNA or RNA helicase
MIASGFPVGSRCSLSSSDKAKHRPSYKLKLTKNLEGWDIMSKYTIVNKTPSAPSAKHWEPNIAQKLGEKFLLDHACGGLLLDPGIGKTSATLSAIQKLKKRGMFERALVIAPRRVCHEVWPVEPQEWEQFNDLRVAVIHGSERKREEALNSEADIYCVNPEGLPWLLGTSNGKLRIATIDPCTLVVDESSKFKHTNTQRFKLLKPFLNKFQRRWILTGSPMPNGYLDLFGQVYMLDLGNALGAYITHYKATYFFPTGYGGYTWKLKPGADKMIQDRIKPLCLRLEAEDYIKLPKLLPSTRRVDLPDKARALYDEMEEELLITLEDGKQVEALSAGAAYNKCSQIANGGLYYLGKEPMAPKAASEFAEVFKRYAVDLHDAKTDEVEEIIEELQGTPCVVAYEFQHDRDRLLKRLGKDVAVIGGGTSDKRASEIIAAWNRREEAVLLAQPSAMGHGLNLQRGGNHVIMHSLTWDYEIYDQFVRRFRRQGAGYDVVFLHHIVARDTVDEAKMRALGAKAREQGTFMKALKHYASNRQKTKALR